ncbi:MAG: hypothetical protein A2566_00680 [Candidatus Zambryskibacteria bacterium RIFOXYD1_FULL_40_13]|nr:MAG: Diguanylate cyclase (GGDEF) domain-containing protein [Parcubacteria group bacterium GW2011_GWC1_39_12]KKR19644.1 MAG: Diguanylate cyclase (GGDEF) domain-containing protein [Parcubacteria group bacterium GW2011_GWF1_39_37]KKR35800.1 MAG: Diguanylate cyclase (GGDEF) domain-containing protein [Parcubacteria group bacterium GW2011_GWC2_40_10]KKR52612.1 MAG: Diguanylate cyclase (GGDEF) domain-containing protein [Parcubacteria group bacterium GW2011_GWE1_40_20]KKR66064.1 MAG: Diguanylate cyc
MKKILIIDDDEIFRKTVNDSLTNAGYLIVEAKDGEEGLLVTEKEKPDLILLDLMMPNMGGMNFLKVLQKEGTENKIPILISSNFTSPNPVEEGIALGIRGYIIKSDESLETITTAINSIIGK